MNWSGENKEPSTTSASLSTSAPHPNSSSLHASSAAMPEANNSSTVHHSVIINSGHGNTMSSPTSNVHVGNTGHSHSSVVDEMAHEWMVLYVPLGTKSI